MAKVIKPNQSMRDELEKYCQEKFKMTLGMVFIHTKGPKKVEKEKKPYSGRGRMPDEVKEDFMNRVKAGVGIEKAKRLAREAYMAKQVPPGVTMLDAEAA